jgi:hypothetical protein
MLLQTQFWQIAHNVFSAPQTKLISGILKKRQELATPF